MHDQQHLQDLGGQNANSRIASKFCANDVPSSVKNWAGASAGSSFNGTVMDL